MTATGWYPLALSAMIEPGTSAGAVLNGQEIVVWRDLKGAAKAWEDRCPHRGMKLSFGFVRGDHIACLYHGWEYDAGGRCRYIPAHPKLDVPDTIRVPTHALAETGGMILVHWPAGETAAAAAPELPPAVAIRSLYCDVAPDTAAAALPAGFGADAAVPLAPSVFALDTDLGRLIVGLQPVAETRVALHLAMTGAPPVATRLAMAGRAEAVRRMLETNLGVAA